MGNIEMPLDECCPHHYVIQFALRTLARETRSRCNPLWSPFLGWQCPNCTVINHPSSTERCHMCIEKKPDDFLPGEESDDWGSSQSLDSSAYSSEDAGRYHGDPQEHIDSDGFVVAL